MLLEKAQLEEPNFSGNKFTEYGHIIEPQIREHINLTYNTNFIPNRVIDGDLRYHSDGFDGLRVLECKSTSEVYSSVDSYQVYLVQLLKGMEMNEVHEGILAVYERPDDLNPHFDPKRLQVFGITLEDYKPLLNHINKEIEKFRSDLERLKENPLLSEQDFLPAGNLVALADKVALFDRQLSALKQFEVQLTEANKQLYNEMVKRNVKSWSTPSGTKITRVDEVRGTTKTVSEFDLAAFRTQNPAMYDKFCRLVEKKSNGKAGYVRITVKSYV